MTGEMAQRFKRFQWIVSFLVLQHPPKKPTPRTALAMHTATLLLNCKQRAVHEHILLLTISIPQLVTVLHIRAYVPFERRKQLHETFHIFS